MKVTGEEIVIARKATYDK